MARTPATIPTAGHLPLGRQARVAGLDSIRLAAAALVALSHGMLIPPQIYDDQGTPFEFWSGQIAHMIANGPAAVAVFFVISGLCIHLGREAAERNPLLFLIRRCVRIGVPLVAMTSIATMIGGTAPAQLQGVLWSIYCEIAYYVIYPLLLVIRRRWRLESIFCVSAIISVVLAALLPRQQLIWAYGCWTIIICYPLWLMGAMLAERITSIVPRRSKHLWGWRFGMLAAGFACSLVRHMSWGTYLPIFTYAVIGCLAVPFLRQEISHAMAQPPVSFVEKLGKASYSLYLTHRIPLAFVDNATVKWPQWAAAPVEVAAVVTSAFLFYVVSERPALQWSKAIDFRWPCGIERPVIP